MKTLIIILCIIAAILYIIGAIVWYTINRNESDLSPWVSLLTAIFWPIILVGAVSVLLVIYILGIIVTVFYELFRNIFNI